MTATATAPPLWELTGGLPDAVALEDAERQRSWRELDERTAAMVHLLEAQGLVPGDHLVVAGSNRLEYVEVALGALRGGFVFTTLKTGSTVDDVGYVLEDARSRLVATDLSAPATAARQRRLPIVDFDTLDEQLAPHLGTPAPLHRAGWKLTYTSGTTGRPKGVRRTGHTAPFSESFPRSGEHQTCLEIPPGGTHLVVSRLCHGAPFTFAMGALASGASLRILDRWEPTRALEELDRDVTSTVVVPTMLRQWLALPDEVRDAHPLRALRRVVHGGEPCPVELKRSAIDWLGPILVEYFGASEGGMTAVNTAEWLARPGTVGRPVSGRVDDIRILDPDGERLGPGEEGRVFFRAEPRFEYVGDPVKTAAAHHGDQFTAGDIGWVDDDGYLYLSGRSSDVIICAGVNVYPAEVENRLGELQGVAELCVVGGPDDERGEMVVACAVPVPGVSGDEVTRAVTAASERLAGHQRPRRVLVRDRPLPRDETGKLLRAVVRRELWEGASAFAGTPKDGRAPTE